MNTVLLERLESAASNTLSVELKALFQDAAEAIRGSDNYIRVVDEELVCAHPGVAKNTDTYEEAKSKLNKVICWNVDLAKDPAVNGGFVLVKQNITPDNPDDYAWPTVEDYERDVGFETNTAFRVAWNMARMTNTRLGLKDQPATEQGITNETNIGQ